MIQNKGVMISLCTELYLQIKSNYPLLSFLTRAFTASRTREGGTKFLYFLTYELQIFYISVEKLNISHCDVTVTSLIVF